MVRKWNCFSGEGQTEVTKSYHRTGVIGVSALVSRIYWQQHSSEYDITVNISEEEQAD